MNQVLVLKMQFFLRFLLIGYNTCFEDFKEDLPTLKNINKIHFFKR